MLLRLLRHWNGRRASSRPLPAATRPAPQTTLARLLAEHGLLNARIPDSAWLPTHEPEPVGVGRWAIPLLDPDWCRGLAARVDALHRACLVQGIPSPDAPNSMNRYGLVVDGAEPSDSASAGPLLDLAPLRTRLAPTLEPLFRDHHAPTLDHHHAFVVRYAMDEDRSLAFHADDAEVTVNIGLDDGHDGGALWFEGARCALHRDDRAHATERGEWRHRPGVALVHAGADRHGALPITRGTRHNLIVWMRSAAARREGGPRPWGLEAECPAWCARARAPGVS